MDECIVFLFFQFQCLGICIIIYAFYHANLCTIALGCFYLGDRCTVRQADHSIDVILCSCQRNTLCMVAGRAGNDALCFFLFGKLRHHIVSTTYLKGTGDLQVFCFQVNFTFRIDFWSIDQIGFPDYTAQDMTCLVDFIECQHIESSSFMQSVSAADRSAVLLHVHCVRSFGVQIVLLLHPVPLCPWKDLPAVPMHGQFPDRDLFADENR